MAILKQLSNHFVGASWEQYRHNTHVGVLAGESTTLYCIEYCEQLTWWLESDLIVKDSQVLENFTERFNVSCNCGSNVCELTILDAQIEDSGVYHCLSFFDAYGTYFSKVTVIRK